MFHQHIFQKLDVRVGVVPTSFGASTAVTGANIVRGISQSAMIILNHALPSQTAGAGTPTGTITLTLTDGATTSPVTAVTMETAIPAVDIAAAGVSVFLVNLEGLNANLKVTATAALTAAGGGNTPLCMADVTVVLGDFSTEPQPSALHVYSRA
jgi:hypothetical protein